MDRFANLSRRATLFRSIREFFYDRDFIEVETPIKIHAPAPEEFIESIPAEGDFLRTSPELAMKCLLADGFERIFQIGACFRVGEHGCKHREEFTMLEFYATGMPYRKMAEFTSEFISSSAQKIFGSVLISYQGHRVDLSRFEYITVADAFLRYAGISMWEAEERDIFDELMVSKIEPKLGRGRLSFLIDYPADRASLARLSPTNPAVAERWELYIEGIELANAFGELTDATEQKVRFEEAQRFRAMHGMHRYPEALEFFAALDRGIPPSSGCAMGLDRLAMIFCDASDIGEVRSDG